MTFDAPALDTLIDNGDATLRHLIDLEHERCRLLVAQDFDGLRELLAPALVHTHTTGKVDDLEGYLRFVREQVHILELTRAQLQVRLHANAAVMTGRQANRARKRDTRQEATVLSQATQLWLRAEDGRWRQAAFHACAVPAL